MKFLFLRGAAVVLMSVGAPQQASAEAAESRLAAPIAFEEALPDEPGSMTLRWLGDYARAREEGAVSVSSQRAQWFFALTPSMSGEVELPVVGLHGPAGSTWAVGRAGLSFKLAPWPAERLPIALRAELELPTASRSLPDEARLATGALFMASAFGRRHWTVQADVGYESAWSSEDRAVVFDAAWIQELRDGLHLHAEVAGVREFATRTLNAGAGPGLSATTRSGVRVGAVALFGITADGERARVLVTVGREF
jgi:hypothetical protein